MDAFFVQVEDLAALRPFDMQTLQRNLVEMDFHRSELGSCVDGPGQARFGGRRLTVSNC